MPQQSGAELTVEALTRLLWRWGGIPEEVTLNSDLGYLWNFSRRRGAEGGAGRRMVRFGKGYDETRYDAYDLLYKTSLELVRFSPC